MQARLTDRLRSFFNKGNLPKRSDNLFCSVVLWAPICDALTEETARWAANVVLPKHLQIKRLIGHVPRGEVEQCLSTWQPTLIVCFFGHGLEHALIGHPFEAGKRGPKATAIYDAELFGLGPTSLFAFCCLAGRALGPMFNSIKGGAFLGYRSEIGIVVTNDESQGTWLAITNAIVREMAESKEISELHRESLYKLYERAFWFYQDGDGINNQDRILMQMYLLGQQEALVYYPARKL